MAYRPNDPNDPLMAQRPADAPMPVNDPIRGPNRMEEDGAISGARIALYAVAVLAIVGALFYGMSSATNDTATNTNAPNTSSMAERPVTAPPAVRDVTPRNNTEPGTTTGAAPAQPVPATPASPATPTR